MKKYNPRKILNSLLCILCLGFRSSLYGSELFGWHPENCQDICPGSWVVIHDEPESFRRDQIKLYPVKQSFDLKNKIMASEQLTIVGKSVWIHANSVQFEYESDSKKWTLDGPVLGRIADIFLEAQSAIYQETKELFHAQDLEFFFERYRIAGKANSLVKHENSIELNTVVMSQCPTERQAWSFHIEKLSYDAAIDRLVFHEPQLFFHDYPILYMDQFSFDGLRAEHPLKNIPSMNIETNSGLTFQWPTAWTHVEENIILIPEINFKQGVGIGAALLKNNMHAKGFFQLIPFDDFDKRSWMASVASYKKTSDFSYGYTGSLVSDPAFCYRYPQAVEFWEDLYLVNNGWLQKNTDYGKFTLSSEKLYRSQEARENHYEVIEYLGRADWTKKDYLTINAGADIIHRYDDHTYQRLHWSSQYDLGAYRGFDARFSVYPHEDAYTGALLWGGESPTLRIPVLGKLTAHVSGSIANSVENPLLLDTIAQPLSLSFLKDGRWHTGMDWNSHGLWITPQWNINISPEIEASLLIAYALKKPSLPWDASNQPYLTPFREDDRFSPLGLSITGLNWNAELLYDVTRDEWISAIWGSHMDFAESMSDLHVFYHKYYPQDRLSQDVESVAQLSYLYETKKIGPWSVKAESTWDLIPIHIAGAALSIKYDECCWEWQFKAKADRQYNPTTSGSQWHYNIGIGIEINGLGMLEEKINPWTFPGEKAQEYLSRNNY